MGWVNSIAMYIRDSLQADTFTERLHVRNFQEPSFDEGMINSLVMHEGRKNILKALSKSFARRNKHDKVVPGDMWSADFVKGKGSGLIFLLHGKPGVGKTCTAGKPASANSISNYANRIFLRMHCCLHKTPAYDADSKRYWNDG